MFQRCPKGSVSWPWRSPQKASASWCRATAPAAMARDQSAFASAVDLQDRGGVADRHRRDDSHVGELAADVHRGFAEGKLDAHHPVARKRNPAELASPE